MKRFSSWTGMITNNFLRQKQRKTTFFFLDLWRRRSFKLLAVHVRSDSGQTLKQGRCHNTWALYYTACWLAAILQQALKRIRFSEPGSGIKHQTNTAQTSPTKTKQKPHQWPRCQGTSAKRLGWNVRQPALTFNTFPPCKKKHCHNLPKPSPYEYKSRWSSNTEGHQHLLKRVDGPVMQRAKSILGVGGTSPPTGCHPATEPVFSLRTYGPEAKT